MRVDPPTRTTWSIAETSLPQSLTARSNGTRHRSTRSSVMPLELRARELLLQVQRAVGGRGHERQVDRRLGHLAELDLRLLRGVLQPLQRHLVGAEVDAVSVLERLHEPIDDALIPVVAAQLRVAVGGLDFEDAVADLEQRNVERAAPEVEDEDGVIRFTLVEPVGERGRGRLVDDAEDFEARDLAGFLGGLALRVVEVRRDRDDGLRHGVAEVGLGVPLELEQDLGADLLRGPALAVDRQRSTPSRPYAA